MSNLLVVGCNGDLYHKRPDQSVVEIFEGHDNPAGWLRQFDNLDLLQVVEISPTANGYLGRSVRLVEAKVCVNGDG